MSKIPISVRKDHLEAMVTTKKPILAVAELIWNALDADAKKITVRFEHNALGGLEQVWVSDNGFGIPYDKAESLFGNLGGSWKAKERKTPAGRALHGQSGKGRFRAFALGGIVEWRTTSRLNGKFVRYSLKGSFADLESFDLSNPAETTDTETGTEVRISNPRKNFVSLTEDASATELANCFAVYLCQYPGITIDYNGTILDPKNAISHRADYDLGEVEIGEKTRIRAQMTVLEWNNQQERALHLCDAHGISLHQLAPSIHAPGYSFTAYLKSDHFRELDKQGLLIVEDLHQEVSALVDAAKSKLKDHFRRRAAEDAAALVKRWKETKVYPYEGEPSGQVEEAERQVFEVVAVNINAFLSDFDAANLTTQRFTFKLVKQALKENPDSLQRIFQDVLSLPKERQDDLAQLLQKTTLPAIISSARLVADRLDFIRGLDLMLFDPASREQLLERDQLHKVLEKETWIFGENFHLTNSDESLNEVLAKYLDRLGKRTDDNAPVTRDGGKTGRVDLMLARTVPQPRQDEWEHLVVELKRPSQPINPEILGQTESYAIAVAKDERFRHTKTKWVFWAISNTMTEEALRKSRQRGRPEGLIFDDAELNITVWAKTWGQLLQDAKARLGFFKKHLEYEADTDSAKAYLKKAHEKYLPKAIADDTKQ